MKLNPFFAAISVALIISERANTQPDQISTIQADRFKNVINRTGSPEYMRNYDFDDHQRFNPFFD